MSSRVKTIRYSFFYLQYLGQGRCFIKCKWMMGVEATNRKDLFVHQRQGTQAGVGKVKPGGVITFLNSSFKMLRN